MSSLALSTYVSPGNWEFIRQQAEKPQPTSTIESLSEELLHHIFGFLSPEELGGACRVCREWRRLASDRSLWDAFNLKVLYPGFNVIDEKVWEKHVDLRALEIDATGAPSLDKRILIPVVSHLSRQVEEREGVTLLTIPKGLTFNKLMQLAGAPKEGNIVPIRHNVSLNLGNIPVDKTYIVVITNSILVNSRNCSTEEQQELVKSFGYEMPELLLPAALAILTYMSSSPELPPVRLYGKDQSTFVRCLEMIEGFSSLVGDFPPTCLKISNYGNNHPRDYIGVAALRKFEVIDNKSRSL